MGKRLWQTVGDAAMPQASYARAIAASTHSKEYSPYPAAP